MLWYYNTLNDSGRNCYYTESCGCISQGVMVPIYHLQSDPTVLILQSNSLYLHKSPQYLTNYSFKEFESNNDYVIKLIGFRLKRLLEYFHDV